MTIDRRTFLRSAAVATAGLGLAGDGLASRALAAAGRRTPASGRVLVVVNLLGGNDLLNTVVPVQHFDRYRALRPAIHIPRHRLLDLPGYEGHFALNQGMGAIRDLFARGMVAVVPGVGMPPNANGLFDHEASQLNVQSGLLVGSAFSSQPTGWVGRLLDSLPSDEGAIPPGVNLSGYANLLLTGRQREALTLFSVESFGVQTTFDSEARMGAYSEIQKLVRDEAAAERHRAVRDRALDQAALVREHVARYVPAVEYPASNVVAAQLKGCAQLIDAGVGVRALAVAGGDSFDTHAAQNDGTDDGVYGYHDYILGQVSDAIGAFWADIEAHGHADDVVVLVVSEFGRRAYENNDRGTDHGFAGASFVVGGSVRGGVYGEYPDLSDARLVFDGNLDTTVDFRSVYATLLAGHFDVDPAEILGASVPTLGF